MSAAIKVRILEGAPDGGDERCNTPGCGRAAEWQVCTHLPHGRWTRDTCTSHVLGLVSVALADVGGEL